MGAPRGNDNAAGPHKGGRKVSLYKTRAGKRNEAKATRMSKRWVKGGGGADFFTNYHKTQH